MKQLSLFEKEIKPLNRITYSSLGVHEKINYKANQLGFQSVVYSSFYNHNSAPLFQPIIDCLTEKYQWHHNTNAGSENRLNSLKGELF